MSLAASAVMAFWLGLLTAIHPCPLATNVVAVAFLGRPVDRLRRVVLSGAVYTLARMATYAALCAVLVTSALSVAPVARFLQVEFNRLLGPLLMVVGMVLAGLIRLPARGVGLGARTQARAERGGLWGAAFLGVVFALSFCPPVAAVFFGTFVPLAVRQQSRLVLPLAYGVGTGLPVLVFAVLVAVSAASVGRLFERLRQVERVARPVTGGVFILVGVYFCLTFIFGVL